MFKLNRENAVKQVCQAAKLIRIFYIIGFAFMAIAVLFVLLALLMSTFGGAPIILIGTTGGIVFSLVVIILLIQIYFFNYYGKVIRQTQAGVYTSEAPALISLILTVLSLIGGLLSAALNIFLLVSMFFSAVKCIVIYIVYKGLITIYNNRLFDDDSEEIENNANIFSPDKANFEPEIVEQSKDNAATDDYDNGSWIKDD